MLLYIYYYTYIYTGLDTAKRILSTPLTLKMKCLP